MKKEEILKEFREFYDKYNLILTQAGVTVERWIKWLDNFDDDYNLLRTAYKFVFSTQNCFLKYVQTAFYMYNLHKDNFNWELMRKMTKSHPIVIDFEGFLMDIRTYWQKRPIKKRRRNE